MLPSGCDGVHGVQSWYRFCALTAESVANIRATLTRYEVIVIVRWLDCVVVSKA